MRHNSSARGRTSRAGAGPGSDDDQPAAGRRRARAPSSDPAIRQRPARRRPPSGSRAPAAAGHRAPAGGRPSPAAAAVRPQPGRYGQQPAVRPAPGQYGQPAYGQPPYGQPLRQPAYGQPASTASARLRAAAVRQQSGRYGQTARPARSRRVGLIAGRSPASRCCSSSRSSSSWSWRCSPTVLDPAAVERDVAAQFEEREGVAIELSCADEMTVERRDLRVHRHHGRRRGRSPCRSRIADEDSAAYTWTEP